MPIGANAGEKPLHGARPVGVFCMDDDWRYVWPQTTIALNELNQKGEHGTYFGENASCRSLTGKSAT